MTEQENVPPDPAETDEHDDAGSGLAEPEPPEPGAQAAEPEAAASEAAEPEAAASEAAEPEAPAEPGAPDEDAELDPTAAALLAQAESFAALSHTYARRGESRLAALALWAADVRAVQALLWREGLGSAPDLSGAVAALSGAVDAALAARDLSGLDLRQLVEEGRRGLIAAFDPSVHLLLEARLTPAEHLDRLPPPRPGTANQAVADRLAGRSGEQLVGDLLAAAHDSRVVARVLADTGDAEEARRQAVTGELEAYDAFLVLGAAAAGDATLVTATLRWDLVETALAGSADMDDLAQLDTGAPVDLDDVRASIRSGLLPAEREALDALMADPRLGG